MYSPDQRFLILDYETFSECDIKKSGAAKYAEHVSTEVLCASYAVGTRTELKSYLDGKRKVASWAPKKEWSEHRSDLHRNKEQLVKEIKDPNVVIVAHNAFFEQNVTRQVLTRHLSKTMGIKGPFYIPPKRFTCTAALASTYALPQKLEGATSALGLKHQKDIEGHRLMLRWSKPKKPSKKDPSTRYTQKFDRLVKYCEHDIYAEIGLFLGLDPIIPQERDLWIYDQELNFRGFRVDIDLVKKILKLIDQEKKQLTEKLREVTRGKIQTGGQTAVIKAFLNKHYGLRLPDLKAKTVEDTLKRKDLPKNARTILKLRQSLSKTSLKKYTSFVRAACEDGVVRGGLFYHGASTGRWSGQLVQPHNFPRGTLKVKDADGNEIDLAPYAAEFIKSGANLSMIRLTFGDPIEVFVSCLRCMIIPPEGHELFVADFAAIEARVLFWLADHKDGVKAFAENRPMYEEMAAFIYKVAIKNVTKDMRFVGKQTILGSGYGMGWKKFQSSCEALGRIVSTEDAKKAINAYREKHKPVVTLWNNIEKAAISAVKFPGKTFVINHTKWFMKKKFLCCELPSGRCLYYYNPTVRTKRTPWGDEKPTLHYWGVNSRTKKWELQNNWGGGLVENCVQAISRDLMAEAMKRIEKAGYRLFLTVHDEIIGSRKIGHGNVEEFCKLMEALPAWGKGIPVKVEGWKGPRYRK